MISAGDVNKVDKSQTYEGAMASWSEHKMTMDWMNWIGGQLNSAGNQIVKGLSDGYNADLKSQQYSSQVDITNAKTAAEIHKASAVRDVEIKKAATARVIAKYQAQVKQKEIDAQVKIQNIKSREKISVATIEQRFKESRMLQYMANRAFLRSKHHYGSAA